MKEEPLFAKRITAYIGKTKWHSNIYLRGVIATWPFSKLELFEKHLVIHIGILRKRFKLKYTDIEYIKKGFCRIDIIHHNPRIDKYVYISGIGNGRLLYKRIKDTADK